MDTGGSSQLKIVFASFVGALLMILGITFVLRGDGPTDASVDGIVGAAIVVVMGISSIAALRFVLRPLDCTSDEALAATYRSRFFLRMAFAEAVSLVAFVMFMLTKNLAIYPLGLAFTAIGFARAWPGGAGLQRDQDELATSGCGRSLADVLG